VSETYDWPDDPAERAQELVEGVLDELDLDGEVVVEENDDRILLTVERKRVVVDAAGYRERRRETLEGRADRAADQAQTNNRIVEMDPMSAQERRVVHERLKERAGIETYSEGDEPNRCVIVAPLLPE
jgi:spoIIIJ-associated protein